MRETFNEFIKKDHDLFNQLIEVNPNLAEKSVKNDKYIVYYKNDLILVLDNRPSAVFIMGVIVREDKRNNGICTNALKDAMMDINKPYYAIPQNDIAKHIMLKLGVKFFKAK